MDATGDTLLLDPDLVAALRSGADDRHDAAVALRRRIHAHPELGLRLPRTQEVVLDALEPLGLRTAEGRSCSSVVAVIEGDRPGPTVLLRADMDALPMPEDTGLAFASGVDGAMHACGHDAHTAMLVTAAGILQANRRHLAGRVLLAFQPGEEGFHGARSMLDDGLLELNGLAPGAPAPSFAFAIHQSPTMRSGSVFWRPGPVMASSDVVRIRVTGRGGHASMPHDACDPVPVACEIVTALNVMVTRRVEAFDPAVLTITRIVAGTTTNVIPETALVEGTIRAVSARTRAAVHANVRQVAAGIAAAHGAEASVTIELGYPVTVNHESPAARVAGVARALVGDRSVVRMPSPVMGAEDFSYVLDAVPGCMAFLGTRPTDAGTAAAVAPNHSNRMVLDEDAMAVGAALYAAVALDAGWAGALAAGASGAA